MMSEKITAKLPEWCPYCGAHSVFRSGSAIFGPYDAYDCAGCKRTHFTQYEKVDKDNIHPTANYQALHTQKAEKEKETSRTCYLRNNDGPFYEASTTEILIINTIVNRNITAHSHEYCFCSKDKNLYCLDIEIKGALFSKSSKDSDVKASMFVTPLFIMSGVTTIDDSLAIGTYEPIASTKFPLIEIFDHFPKVKGDKKT